MDDIAPLRALAAGASASAGLRLFAPASAVRLHEPPFTGTPMPKDEPMATNPPLGAYIDYALDGTATTTPVRITVYDAQGALVNRFSSSDPAPALDLAKIDAAPEWLTRAAPPSAAPGQHRFVWNLHYAAPAAPPGGDAAETDSASSVWAPPGL